MDDQDEQQARFLAEAKRLEARVAERLAWCEANPVDAARRYGIAEIIRPRKPFGRLSITASLHAWTEAIAREIVPADWRWRVGTDAYTGNPTFVITDYLPEPRAARPTFIQ